MASIEHRHSKGGDVWRVRFRDSGRQRVVTFDRQDRAEAWVRLVAVDRDAALRMLEAPTVTKPVPTLAEMVRLHIDALSGVTDGTRREYGSYLDRDIAPHPIGSVPVDILDRPLLAAWVQWLSTRLAGKTVANRHGLVSAAMSTAVELGHAPANPCRGMRLPRTSHSDAAMVVLTPPEFLTLLDHIPEHYRPLVLLLVGTGMRLGEATALQVGDVDVRALSIRIRRAWKRTGGVPELGPTKTARSDRTAAVPREAMDAIAPLVRGRAPSALLLTTRRGGPIRQAPFWRRSWRPAVHILGGDETRVVHDAEGRAEIEVVTVGPGKHPRIHDLRHTFASWAIQDGVPLPVIQRQLGHESIKTTIDTYGHLARADFDALASGIGARLASHPQIEG